MISTIWIITIIVIILALILWLILSQNKEDKPEEVKKETIEESSTPVNEEPIVSETNQEEAPVYTEGKKEIYEEEIQEQQTYNREYNDEEKKDQ